MVDVFISYSRSNQDVVRRLADAVKRLGYIVWWDDELPPHLSYGDVITEKIGRAKAAIVVWSEGSAGSEWVRAEADLARNQKKLIQTSIDDRMPPMPFNQIQFASIGDWDGISDHPGWRKVQASLTALCGPPGHAAAAAPPPFVGTTQPPRPLPPGKSNVFIIAAIAGSLAVILAIAGLMFLRGREPAPAAVASATIPANTAAPAADRVAPAVKATDRGPAPEAPRSADTAPEPREILPDSSVRALTEEDVQELSPQQIRLARNEIFARRGRIFQDPRLRAHFSRYSWYRPTATEVRLSPVEQANVALLRQAESW